MCVFFRFKRDVFIKLMDGLKEVGDFIDVI